MGREQGIRELVQGALAAGLLLEHIEAHRGHLARGHEVGHRGHVEDAAAGAVDEDHAVFHGSQLGGAEKPHGLGGLGQVDGDEVGQGEDLLHRVEQLHTQRGGPLGAAVGVVPHETHAEAAGALGHEPADAAEAEDGERLLVELGAGEGGALPRARVHGRVGLGQAAGAGQEQRHGVLGGRDDVGGGGVADDDAALRGGLHVDVVDGHAGSPDDLEAAGRVQELRRHLGLGAHDERVVGGDGRRQGLRRQVEPHVHLIALAPQDVQTLVGDLLRDQNPLARHGVRSPSSLRWQRRAAAQGGRPHSGR